MERTEQAKDISRVAAGLLLCAATWLTPELWALAAVKGEKSQNQASRWESGLMPHTTNSSLLTQATVTHKGHTETSSEG